MSGYKKITVYLVVAALAVAGVILGKPSPVRAAVPGGDTGGGGGAVGVPWFGVAAIAVIATLAIWQGVVDARKKKKVQKEKEQDLEEEGEFQKYFEDEGTTDETAPPGTADAETAVPAPSTPPPPAEIAP